MRWRQKAARCRRNCDEAAIPARACSRTAAGILACQHLGIGGRRRRRPERLPRRFTVSPTGCGICVPRTTPTVFSLVRRPLPPSFAKASGSGRAFVRRLGIVRRPRYRGLPAFACSRHAVGRCVVASSGASTSAVWKPMIARSCQQSSGGVRQWTIARRRLFNAANRRRLVALPSLLPEPVPSSLHVNSINTGCSASPKAAATGVFPSAAASAGDHVGKHSMPSFRRRVVVGPRSWRWLCLTRPVVAFDSSLARHQGRGSEASSISDESRYAGLLRSMLFQTARVGASASLTLRRQPSPTQDDWCSRTSARRLDDVCARCSQYAKLRHAHHTTIITQPTY